jgi:Tol biopolymer transport system component
VNLRRGVCGVSRPLGLAAVLVLLLACAPAAQAAFPGPNGKIAYTDDGGNYFGGGDIYTVNPDGTGATNITNSVGYRESSPTWSPDGNKIAYRVTWDDGAGHTRLEVRNLDGSDPVQVNIEGSNPTWSPDGTKLAFDSHSYYGTDISVINSDGTGFTNLTGDQSYHYNSSPSWSPDGTKIAFDRGGQIWMMNADGSGRAALMSPTGPVGGSRPNWSPDGRRLVFHTGGDYGGEIRTVNADGTGLTNLTNTPNAAELDAAFSPDGTKIVFSVAVPDHFDGGFLINQNDLYVMKADGTGRTALLTATASSQTAGDWQPVGSPPPPAPDLPGKIAFATNRDNINNNYDYEEWEIYVMNPDGSSQRRRTINGVGDGSPSWSPDGTKIAFGRDDPEGGIWTMNADGSGETRLTSGWDKDPTWSPDGKKIAFTRYPAECCSSRIWIVNSDGTGEAPLPNLPDPSSGCCSAYAAYPAWSPDGTKIAFASSVDEHGNATDKWQIYTVNPDGTGLQNLSNVYQVEGESDGAPAWSQDGKAIAFTRGFPYKYTPSQIWIMWADGTGQAKVTNLPAGAYSPTWSPLGNKIAFMSSSDVFAMTPDGTEISNLTHSSDGEREPDWQAIDRPLVTSYPPISTTSTTAMFEFSFPRAGTSYECSLDDSAFESCESPKQYTGLTDGAHRFQVRSGPLATPAVRGFTVDATPPEAFGLDQPADGLEVKSDPAFSWGGTTDATSGLSHYDLLIDGSKDQELGTGSCSEGTCTAHLSSRLPDGHHTWQVQALDSFGNVRESETRSFTVVDRPTATLAVTPTLALTGEDVSFDASGSTDPNGTIARYQWDLDGDGSFERDTGTDPRTTKSYPSRFDGTVKVRVTDSGGLSAEAGQALVVTKVSASGHFGISINGGAEVTNDRHVQIDARWPSRAINLLISNDGGFNAPSVFPVDSPISWTLASGGPQLVPKTVYVRFTGGESGRETYTDDIVLDETQPAVQSATATPIGGGSKASASRTRARKYRVRIRARDAVTGIAAIQVSNTRRAGKLRSVKKARKFTGSVVFKSKGSRIYVRVRDVAGNFSRWRKARITGQR